MSHIAGCVAGVVLLCWGQVAYAEKVLTILGTQTHSADTVGRDFASPSVLSMVDETSNDAVTKAFAAIFHRIAFGVGGVHMELIDKNGHQVFEIDGKSSDHIRILLSTEVGAAAAGSAHDVANGIGHWIVDETSFSTGIVRLEISGEFFGFVRAEARISGTNVDAYLEGRDMEGLWVVEFPFIVTE